MSDAEKLTEQRHAIERHAAYSHRDAMAVIIKLEGRIAELDKDAARYRWLRDTGDGKPMVLIESRWYGNQHRAGLDLDAAIDAAMQGSCVN